jgi:hypothetical protein
LGFLVPRGSLPHFPLQIPTLELPTSLPLGPQHNCHQPQWRVVCSIGSMSPSVMSLGPTILACLVDSLACGAYPRVHVHSKAIQWLGFFQIYDTDLFSISRFRASRFSAPPHLKLPFAEIMKSLSTLPLDPMVKFLSYDLQCRSLQNFKFLYFTTCENKVLHLWIPGCQNVVQQPCVPLDGRSRRIWDFEYRDFHIPVQLERVFKPCVGFPYLTVTRVLLFPKQILWLQHF